MRDRRKAVFLSLRDEIRPRFLAVHWDCPAIDAII
jgi:hypothetical protein